MNLQTFFVLIAFLVASGYLLRKFVLIPILDSRKKQTKSITLDGGKTKCGNDNCACH